MKKNKKRTKSAKKPEKITQKPEEKDDPEASYDDLLAQLSEKKAKFVEEFLIDLNASRAAIRAGYAKKTALHQSYKLLLDVGVKTAINAGKKEISRRTRINQDEVIKELAKIGFADIKDFVKWGPSGVALKSSEELTEDQSRVVLEVSETITKDGGTVKFKLHDKVKALMGILDRVKPGADDPQQHEHTIKAMTLFPPEPRTISEWQEMVKVMNEATEAKK